MTGIIHLPAEDVDWKKEYQGSWGEDTMTDTYGITSNYRITKGMPPSWHHGSSREEVFAVAKTIVEETQLTLYVAHRRKGSLDQLIAVHPKERES